MATKLNLNKPKTKIEVENNRVNNFDGGLQKQA